jgi:hypothetical protein
MEVQNEELTVQRTTMLGYIRPRCLKCGGGYGGRSEKDGRSLKATVKKKAVVQVRRAGKELVVVWSKSKGRTL